MTGTSGVFWRPEARVGRKPGAAQPLESLACLQAAARRGGSVGLRAPALARHVIVAGIDC